MEDVHTREWCLFHSVKRTLTKQLNLLQIRAILKVLDEAEFDNFWIWKDGYEDWMPLLNCETALRPLSEGQEELFPPPPPGMEADYRLEDDRGERVFSLEDGHDEPLALETVITTIGSGSENDSRQYLVPEKDQIKFTGESGSSQVSNPRKEGQDTENMGAGYIHGNVFEYQEGTAIAEHIEIDDQDFVEKRAAVRYRRRYKVIISVDGNQHVTHTVSISTKSMQVEGKLPYWVPRDGIELILERYGQKLYLVCRPYGETRDQVLLIDSISEPGTFQKWLLEW